MAKCSYHPDREAVTKCERCNRLICLEDKMVFRRRRSTGTGDSRTSWSERYEYCPICHSEATISQSRSNIIFSIFAIAILVFFGIMAFTIFSTIPSETPGGGPMFDGFFNVFGGFFVFTILIMFVIIFYSTRGSPEKAEEAKRRQEEFINSLEKLPSGLEKTSSSYSSKIIRQGKTSQMSVYCSDCGTKISLDNRYCPVCGDPTSDEKEAIGYS